MAWYAIQCLPQCEQKAKTSIERMGFNVIVPVACEQRRRLRRGVIVEQKKYVPMFSTYLFIECEALPDWLYHERMLLRPLPSWKEPHEIPFPLIKEMIIRSGEITVNEWAQIQSFAKGDKIRRKGDNSGLTMLVDEVKNNKLVALVEFLGKLHRKVLPYSHVEAAE